MAHLTRGFIALLVAIERFIKLMSISGQAREKEGWCGREVRTADFMNSTIAV